MSVQALSLPHKNQSLSACSPCMPIRSIVGGCGNKNIFDFQRYSRFTSLSLGGQVPLSATILTFPPTSLWEREAINWASDCQIIRLKNHTKGLALAVAARQYFAVSILLRNFEKQMDNTSASKLPSIIHSLFRPMVVCSPCHCSRSAERSSSSSLCCLDSYGLYLLPPSLPLGRIYIIGSTLLPFFLGLKHFELPPNRMGMAKRISHPHGLSL